MCRPLYSGTACLGGRDPGDAAERQPGAGAPRELHRVGVAEPTQRVLRHAASAHQR
jgi:hypothetical protein